MVATGTEPPKPRRRKLFPIFLNTIGLLLTLCGFAIKYYVVTKLSHRREAEYTARIIAARQGSPIARMDQLKGSGRIYLLQMGPHTAPYALDDFAQRLRSKYGLDVEILPAVDLDSAAWDPTRKQYIGEMLTGELNREHPSLAADPQAYLIGFTDADMYPVENDWKFTFTWRDMPRTAVISAHSIQDTGWERWDESEATRDSHLQTRLRRILLKDVAILYWHLSQNYDPASLLQVRLDPDLPLEDIYESDVAPERTRWGRYEGEPCIFFKYSAKGGMQPLPGNLIRSCSDVKGAAIEDESQELFEVDLRLGLLIDRHTDFYLPDTVPIEFERATRDGWRVPAAFGISGTHSYDGFLGSIDGMRTVNVYYAEGGNLGLRRVPAWLSMLSLVKYVDAESSGRMYELRWHPGRSEHFELKNYRREVTSYLPCAAGTPPCYENGFRNAKGEALVFERNPLRMLTRLKSPHGDWLQLSYDESNRISEINDSRGRKVKYGYDEGGRLVKVAYPSGEIFYYEYDSMQHLLTFSVAPDAQAARVVLLRNEYEHGRIARQSFGGKIYSYSYDPPPTDPIKTATVRTPEGTVFDIGVGEWDSCVRTREVPPGR